MRSAAEEALRQDKNPPGAQPESQQRDASAEALLPTVLYGPDEPTAPATTEVPSQDTDQPADPLKRQCQQNLRENLQELYAGIKAYQKSHGDIPNWLSDLVPQYIAKTNILICPTQTDASTSVTSKRSQSSAETAQRPRLCARCPAAHGRSECSAAVCSATNLTKASKDPNRSGQGRPRFR